MPNPTSDVQLSIAAGELAELLRGTLVGPSDLTITGIAPIESGGPGDLTFIRAQSFARHWPQSACSAALVTEGVEVPDHDPQHRAIIRVPDADLAFAAILERIDPGTHTPPPGVHPSSTVDPTASIHPNATVGPNCTVGPRTELAEGVALIAGVHIGADVSIDQHTLLHPGAIIADRCRIGKRCIVHPNAVIGSDGFGFIPPTNDQPAIRIPQIGTVVIGDDCEIGAGSTIDRAKLGATRIGNRVKLDNLVHIGHNVTIGDDCILCGRVTLGGSVTVGARVMFGGAVTISDQVTIGDNAKLGGGSIAMDDIPANEMYVGIPAMPARTALANYAALRSIADFTRRTDKAIKHLNTAVGIEATKKDAPHNRHAPNHTTDPAKSTT